MLNYKLNPDYTPSEGDYLSAEDWTDDQIEWLATNTPEGWWNNREWRLDVGFGGKSYLEYWRGKFYATANLEGNNTRITPDQVLIPFVQLPGVVRQITITATLVWGDNEPPYQELWVADFSNEFRYCTRPLALTHNKSYKAFDADGTNILIIDDNGDKHWYHRTFFKPVKLYDEDESTLICRDIEFEEGDYIDLREHTPYQVRHIAKFYKFYDVDGLLSGYWNYCRFSTAHGFLGTGRYMCTGKEYHYNDIFYSED